MQINQLVEKYIALRDRKDQMKKKFKDETAEIDAALDKAESYLMGHMRKSGIEAIKTDVGTAYIQTRTSASVQDRDVAQNFIQTNNLWSMLDFRVNKTAVDEYRKEHNDLPPGVGWSEEIVVNVRRS